MEQTSKRTVEPVVSVEQAQRESVFFSSERVLGILKLILAGSPLSEVLTIIARLVESQGEGTICTIWLPDEAGKQLNCVAAPSMPGFPAHVGPTIVGPKCASCGTAAYRREPVYVTDILTDALWVPSVSFHRFASEELFELGEELNAKARYTGHVPEVCSGS